MGIEKIFKGFIKYKLFLAGIEEGGGGIKRGSMPLNREENMYSCFFRKWAGFNWLSLGVTWQAYTYSIMDWWVPKQVQGSTQ
jgi:hypothetical protein